MGIEKGAMTEKYLSNQCVHEDPETGEKYFADHYFLDLEECPLRSKMSLTPGSINIIIRLAELKSCINCGLIVGHSKL